MTAQAPILKPYLRAGVPLLALVRRVRRAGRAAVVAGLLVGACDAGAHHHEGKRSDGAGAGAEGVSK